MKKYNLEEVGEEGLPGARALLLASCVTATYWLGLFGIHVFVYVSGPSLLPLVGVRVIEPHSEWPGTGRAFQNLGEMV